jgi:hypothetical protein
VDRHASGAGCSSCEEKEKVFDLLVHLAVRLECEWLERVAHAASVGEVLEVFLALAALLAQLCDWELRLSQFGGTGVDDGDIGLDGRVMPG